MKLKNKIVIIENKNEKIVGYAHIIEDFFWNNRSMFKEIDLDYYILSSREKEILKHLFPKKNTGGRKNFRSFYLLTIGGG